MATLLAWYRGPIPVHRQKAGESYSTCLQNRQACLRTLLGDETGFVGPLTRVTVLTTLGMIRVSLALLRATSAAAAGALALAHKLRHASAE
jgi:hypothetical protein